MKQITEILVLYDTKKKQLAFMIILLCIHRLGEVPMVDNVIAYIGESRV